MTEEQKCLLIYFIYQLYNESDFKLPNRSEMFKFLKIYLKEKEELDKKKMEVSKEEEDDKISFISLLINSTLSTNSFIPFIKPTPLISLIILGYLFFIPFVDVFPKFKITIFFFRDLY